MYKKHFEHFLTVSLKCLFDFDYTNFHNAYLAILVVPFMIQLLVVGVAAYLYDGLVTVKGDLNEIKANVIVHKQSWDNSEMKETIAHNLRLLKNNLIENNFRTWRSN